MKKTTKSDIRHAELVGTFAFFVGLALAVLAGLPGPETFSPGTRAVAMLLITLAGFLVGILNIRDEEIKGFLIATIALLVAIRVVPFGTLTTISPGLATAIQGILEMVGLFVAPAAVVLALKEIWSIGRSRG